MIQVNSYLHLLILIEDHNEEELRDLITAAILEVGQI